MIINTILLPPRVFKRDVNMIEAFHGHYHKHHKIQDIRATQYSFGEYLLQGVLKVRGKCSFGVYWGHDQ